MIEDSSLILYTALDLYQDKLMDDLRNLEEELEKLEKNKNLLLSQINEMKEEIEDVEELMEVYGY